MTSTPSDSSTLTTACMAGMRSMGLIAGPRLLVTGRSRTATVRT